MAGQSSSPEARRRQRCARPEVPSARAFHLIDLATAFPGAQTLIGHGPNGADTGLAHHAHLTHAA